MRFDLSIIILIAIFEGCGCWTLEWIVPMFYCSKGILLFCDNILISCYVKSPSYKNFKSSSLRLTETDQHFVNTRG